MLGKLKGIVYIDVYSPLCPHGIGDVHKVDTLGTHGQQKQILFHCVHFEIGGCGEKTRIRRQATINHLSCHGIARRQKGEFN